MSVLTANHVLPRLGLAPQFTAAAFPAPVSPFYDQNVTERPLPEVCTDQINSLPGLTCLQEEVVKTATIVQIIMVLLYRTLSLTQAVREALHRYCGYFIITTV